MELHVETNWNMGEKWESSQVPNYCFLNAMCISGHLLNSPFPLSSHTAGERWHLWKPWTSSPAVVAWFCIAHHARCTYQWCRRPWCESFRNSSHFGTSVTTRAAIKLICSCPRDLLGTNTLNFWTLTNTKNMLPTGFTDYLFLLLIVNPLR